MKKLTLLVLCIGMGNAVYGMDYLNAVMEYPWRWYVHSRYPNLIDKLSQQQNMKIYQKAKSQPQKLTLQDTINKLQNRLAEGVDQAVQKEYADNIEPWYVRWGSYLSPKESESSLIERVYLKLRNAFNSTFYPDKKYPSTVIEGLTMAQASEINTINSLLLRGKSAEGIGVAVQANKSEFINLVSKLRDFITDLNSNLSINFVDKTRINSLSSVLDDLEREVENPRPALAEWYRKRAAERIKKYFYLK